jgi:hypothetical protein
MRSDGKTPQPFPFPYFIIENGSGSGNGIYRLWKQAGTGNLSECIIVKSPFTSHEYNTTHIFTQAIFRKYV